MAKNIRLLTTTIALGVILISMLGIAYAITFQGETANTGNDDDSQYIVLTLGDNTASDYSGSFAQNKIYYDTVTDSTGTTWTPQLDTDTDNDSVNDSVKTGFVILNVDTTDSFEYDIKMSKTGTMDTTKFVIGVKTGTAAETFVAFGNNEFVIAENLTGDKTITISLYYKATTVTSAPGDIMDNVRFNISSYAEY